VDAAARNKSQMPTRSRSKSVDFHNSDHRATGMHVGLYSSVISSLSLINAKGEDRCQ
jgi:hypothetical protein